MRLFSIIVVLFMVSCKPMQNTTSQKPVPSKSNQEQISFFYFQAKRVSDTSIDIVLHKQVNVNGKVKGIFSPQIPLVNLTSKNWLVTFVDNDSQSITQVKINNPLIENIEYIQDDGGLARKIIQHQTREFVIRIPFSNSIKMIKFEQIRKIDQNLKRDFIAIIEL